MQWLRLHFKKRVGMAASYLLLELTVLFIVVSMLSDSITAFQSSYFSGLSAGRVEIEAQQWAKIKATNVELTGFDNIKNVSRRTVEGSNNEWEYEYVVGPEQTIGENNKQKDVMVNIYKHGENVSRIGLKVPLSSQDSGNKLSDVKILTGTIGNGGQIPLPDGYTQDECVWFVSSNYDYISNDHSHFDCNVDSNRIVTVRTRNNSWNIRDSVANYIIIGIKR